MSKALKHSLEWKAFSKPTKNLDGSDFVITPYSRLTRLQIHTKGYTKEGKFVEGHYGHGDETLFVNLGLKAQPDANGHAKLIHDGLILGPKMENEILV
jgi:hypothetical protein